MKELEAFFSERHLGDYLDVACGEGEFTERLLAAASGYRSAEGIDQDPESIATAESDLSAGYEGLRFQIGDAAMIDAADNAYDTASISNALHHVESPEEVVAELWRVLRPGGLLVVNEMIQNDMNPKQQIARDLHHLKARIDRLKCLRHDETYHLDSLEELLIGATGTLVLLATTETPEPDDEEQLSRRVEFLESYAELAEDHPEYAAVRKEALRLKHRLRSVGFQPQPQRIYVLSR